MKNKILKMKKYIKFIAPCLLTFCIIINTLGDTSPITAANIKTITDTKIIDSIRSYSKKCNVYLSREIFSGTPLNGEILAKAAYKVYTETGIIVPYELVLSQAQNESHMGLKGLSKSTNPFNVGEWDSATKRTFNTTYEGTLAYYRLISNDYIKNNSIDKLRKSFVNKDGYRYASDPDYERKVFKQFDFIKRWVIKNLNNK